jgi:lambda family phage portal protein
MVDIPNRPGLYELGAATSEMYPNLQSYEGQINTTPQIFTMAHEVKRTRKQAVRAVRHAERSQEHIRGGLDRKTDMVVGASLRVLPRVDYELLGMTREEGIALGRQFELNFRDWAYDARCYNDSEGHYDFGGLMWLAFRNFVGADSETAGILHFDEDRRKKHNLRWATHLQIIDTSRIDTPSDMQDDHSVFEGRKLDRYGRMIGLYVQDFHEGGPDVLGVTFSYYPRETKSGRPHCFHFFKKNRPGQHRGLNALVTVLKHSSMLDKFDDAQLAAAVLNAVFAVYVKSTGTPDAVAAQLNPKAGDKDPRVGYYEQQSAKFRYGGQRLAVLPPGDELAMEAVNRAAQDSDAFVNQFLRKFAVAINVPYELLAGNYSDANYSSIRAALVDSFRSVLAERGLFFRHVPALVYQVICEEAIARGRVTLPANALPFAEYRAAYCRAQYIGPPMGWVDPKREAEAAAILLDKRLTSHDEEILARGGDIDDVFEAWGRAIDLAQENGFDLLAPTMPQPSFGSDVDPDQDVDADPHADIDGQPKPKKAAGPAAPPSAPKKEDKK